MADATAQNLAANVRQLREARGVSQQHMAELAGLPRPTWANIESGEANPTLAVLTRVASALGATLEELIGAPQSRTRFWAAETLPTQRRGRVSVRTLLAEPGSGLSVERMVLQPGATLAGDAHAPQTFEYVTCEVGEVTIEVNGEQHVLLSGDLLAFRADQPHGYRNATRVPCTAFSIVTHLVHR
jgi:XRE family transcriptional regulator, regulator of sulfur utilization